MAFYNLLRDNFTIIKTKTNRLHLKCKHCNKMVREEGTRFDWEKWSVDTHSEFVFMESRITFHLLFKCRVSNIKTPEKVISL